MPAEAPDRPRVRIDVPAARLPRALAELHQARAPFHLVEVELSPRAVPPIGLDTVVAGAGFTEAGISSTAAHEGSVTVTLRRDRTLADTVGPGMRLLVCGLNPSFHAADRGIGYAGPGNRFWPAAVAAGLVTTAFDPHAALDRGIGMTDLVKRPTPRAAEVTTAEHRDGLARVGALVEWLAPVVVCMVGLDGWRRAVDRRARPGWQTTRLGSRPVYLMPSTSGLNTHCTLDQLVAHLRAATSTDDRESLPSHP